MSKFSIFILMILIINIHSKISNICIDSKNNCMKKNRKKEKEKMHHENLNFQKPTILDFLYQSLYNRFVQATSSYYKYIDGFKYICKNFYNLYYSYIHKDDIQLNQFRNLFDDEEEEYIEENKNKKENKKKKIKENENEKINREILLRDLQSFAYNQTNFYNNFKCIINSPNLKVYHKLYFCNQTKVSFEDYQKYYTDDSSKCEYYINMIKVCFCPITYKNCFSKEASSLFCKIKSLTANNNEYDLLKGRDKFYYEYMNRTLLPLSKKKFIFNLTLSCYNPIETQDNFYLSTDVDKYGEIEIISTEYDNNDTISDKKQYNIEDINNRTNNILKYFYRDENFIFYDPFQLQLSFTIYEMNWIMPFRTYIYDIPFEKAKKFLNGEPLIFEIDLDKLIKNTDGVDEIFKDKKYKAFLEGDIYFYEIKIVDKLYEQIIFYNYHGEIDRNS